MIMQLHATLLDSLRLLRSRHLFRLTMVLSTIAAFALFGTYSFNKNGIKFLFFDTWENPLIASNTPGMGAFIAYMFNDVFLKYWLSWGAMILAVVSTASILPDFLSSGAIELSLARPISRARMLVYRIVGAVLFVLVQSIVGVTLAYVLIGLKFGAWIHGMLWAIPLLTLQFFYLFSFSTLLAVVTRSTLACVIGTVLLWFLTFIIQFSASQLNTLAAQQRSMNQQQSARIERLEREISEATPEQQGRVAAKRASIASAQRRKDDSQRSLNKLLPYAKRLSAAEIVVPKTGDLRRIMANQAKAPTGIEFFSLLSEGKPQFRPQEMSEEEWADIQQASDDAERELRNVNVPLSLGSSLAGTCLLYGVAILIFARRDF